MSSRMSAGITGITGMISVPSCVAKVDQSRPSKAAYCYSACGQNAPGHPGDPGVEKQTTCRAQVRSLRTHFPTFSRSSASHHRIMELLKPTSVTSKVTSRLPGLPACWRNRPKHHTGTRLNPMTGCRPHFRNPQHGVGTRLNCTTHRRFRSSMV